MTVEDCKIMRSVIEGLLRLLHDMQDACQEYLRPDFMTTTEDFVGKILGLTDGRRQQEVEKTAVFAIELANKHTGEKL